MIEGAARYDDLMTQTAHRRPLRLELGAALVALAIAGCDAARADAVADFYKGRRIDMIAAGEAGTTQDTWARLLARYMPALIPGRPAMVVRNMPGSGHIKAAGYLFNLAPQDGTTVGTFSATIVTGYILKLPGIVFDVTKFNWLGSPDKSNRICVAKPGAAVQRAHDLFERDLIVGGTGATGGVSGPPTLLRGLLGMRFKLVEGYPSPSEVLLAMERGELDGICNLLSGVENARPNWISEGRLKVLFNMEKEPLVGIDAPSVYDFTRTDEQRQILSFYGGGLELGRPFLAPPGVPKDRIEALRNAFAAALKHPDLIQEAQRARMDIKPVSGEELAKIVDALASVPAEIADKTNRLLGAGK
jgi:tripartite-type tricarboxylate transporter receptor subunit TctC